MQRERAVLGRTSDLRRWILRIPSGTSTGPPSMGPRAALGSARSPGVRGPLRALAQHDPQVRLARSWARERPAREGAADQPYVALRHPQGITDVTSAVSVHIADLRVTERRRSAGPQAHVMLRDEERVTDIHHAVPVHVAAQDRAGQDRHGAE